MALMQQYQESMFLHMFCVWYVFKHWCTNAHQPAGKHKNYRVSIYTMPISPHDLLGMPHPRLIVTCSAWFFSMLFNKALST